MAREKKMLPSFILCSWALFLTHCLFVCMSPASQHCLEPYFTLIGIIDTYANMANSPRQHHILWHPRQKVDLAGWLVHVQRHALAQGHTQKCSHLINNCLEVTDRNPKMVTKFQWFCEVAWEYEHPRHTRILMLLIIWRGSLKPVQLSGNGNMSLTQISKCHT